MKKALLLIAPFLLAACSPDESRFKSLIPAIPRPAFEDRFSTPAMPSEASEAEAEAETPAGMVELPEAINLDVPFYSQAPDEDWSYPWQEACEEASIALAYHYFVEPGFSKEDFKKDVLALVDWQNEHFGDYWHTTMEQTAMMLEEYYGFSDYRILENPTIEDLKRELAQGHPIVAPFDGQGLENPFFSNGGPYYHVLVIKGYDRSNFITNDVGTRRGQDFTYPQQKFMSALHDYHPTNMKLGAKKVIVLE